LWYAEFKQFLIELNNVKAYLLFSKTPAMKWLFPRLFSCCLCSALLLSCNPGLFNQPRFTRVQNIKGKILMQNGSELDGVIMVNLRLPTHEDGYLRFKASGQSETSRVYIKDLKGFTASGVYYEPRRADDGRIGRPPLYFMRRLTPDSSRIHLFVVETEVTNMSFSLIQPPVEIERDFFMVLPQQQEKYASIYLRNRNLTPNFDEKMSAYVKDCPSLAEKIKQKENGYFYSDMTFMPRRVNVMMTIINEYNACR
jgi:hypothetical protein